jgi:hypothetical protein
VLSDSAAARADVESPRAQSIGTNISWRDAAQSGAAEWITALSEVLERVRRLKDPRSRAQEDILVQLRFARTVGRISRPRPGV